MLGSVETVGGEVEVGEGLLVGKAESLGDGVGGSEGDVPKVNDQILLQSLQVPPASLTLTRQYQVPLFRDGV